MSQIFATIESYNPKTKLGTLYTPGINEFKRTPFHASALPDGFVPAVGTIVRYRPATWAVEIVPARD